MYFPVQIKKTNYFQVPFDKLGLQVPIRIADFEYMPKQSNKIYVMNSDMKVYKKNGGKIKVCVFS